MAYDLAAMTRRAKNPRRREIPIRPIQAPGTLATDLYRECYLPIIRVWAAAGERLATLYAQSLAQITTDSPADMGAELAATETTVNALIVELTARLGNWAVRVERWHRTRWRGAVLSATGVDIGTIIGQEGVRETIGATIARNVSLVKSVSDQARLRIGEAVFDGYNNRRTPQEVTNNIRKAVGMSRDRARRIAGDQTTKLAESLNDERRREAGMPDWIWRHSGKVHFRVTHKRRNGHKYTDGVKSGERKPPDDRPGQLPYCGCTSQALLVF